MKKRKQSKVSSGVLAAVIGLAAGLFLMSKPGKKFRKDVAKKSAGFSKYLAPHIKKIQKMTATEYKAFMKTAMKKYGQAKKLSLKDQREILGDIQKSWKKLKKQF